MKIFFSIRILSLILFIPYVLQSEILISLNPGIISFSKIPNTNYYGATLSVEVAVQSDEEGWSLNLLGSSLVSSEGEIAPDRQYVKKHYNAVEEDVGAGAGYEQMNTTIYIGSGGITSGYEVVNQLDFRVLIHDTDQQGTYQGEAKIQTDDEVYYAVLSMTLEVNPYLDFSVNKTDLLFEVNGPPGVYDADTPIELTYNSNDSEWKIESEFIEISPQNGLSGNDFFVSSSNYEFSMDEGAGEGFMKMIYPREVMNGEIGGATGSTNLSYRIKTEYNYVPGEYTGSFKLDSPEYPNPITLSTKVNISEYLYIEVDQTQVSIASAGPPDLYDGDKPVKIKVASNAESWQVTAEASDLVDSDNIFPKDRLYVNSSQMDNVGDEGAGEGYMSLEEKKIVALGEQTELTQVTDVHIRVKTTEMDKAGNYSGTINFIIVGLPE